MKRIAYILLLIINVIFMGLANQSPSPDFASLFQGYNGCFVLYDMKENSYIRYNEKRCEERLSPCSTFKIPNSLIGLETGVIKDENHVYKWDGVQRPRESWNRDCDLRYAIANSVVWYYQKLASEVGEPRMKEWIKKLHYGNEDISGGIAQFWLGSTLKISANEQIGFLTKFYKNDLPFSQRSIDIVKDILILSQTEKSVFRGKTGSGYEPGVRSWGWFVGYVETGGNTYIFATNIEAKDEANGKNAREVTENILRSLSLL
jgi:beta-lactamase class D